MVKEGIVLHGLQPYCTPLLSLFLVYFDDISYITKSTSLHFWNVLLSFPVSCIASIHWILFSFRIVSDKFLNKLTDEIMMQTLFVNSKHKDTQTTYAFAIECLESKRIKINNIPMDAWDRDGIKVVQCYYQNVLIVQVGYNRLFTLKWISTLFLREYFNVCRIVEWQLELHDRFYHFKNWIFEKTNSIYFME